MAKTHIIKRFTVRGRFQFPLDMLRYDQCWPADSESATQIRLSLEGHKLDPGEMWIVRLNRAQEFTYSEPTKARWSSFCWSVDPEDDDV